jgi:hypothetical protein
LLGVKNNQPDLTRRHQIPPIRLIEEGGVRLGVNSLLSACLTVSWKKSLLGMSLSPLANGF